MGVADLQALVLAGLYVAGVTLAFAGNRTMLHVGMGNLVWFALLFEDPRWAFGGLAALLVGATAAHLARPRLWDDVLAGERDLGPVMFFLGLCLVAAPWALGRMSPLWLLVAVLPMTFADPVGFYAGRAWGRHRLPNGKSLEGFAAVFVAALLTLLALPLVLEADPRAWDLRAWGGALFFWSPVALANAAAETFAPRHLDNVLMPLASLGSALLMFHFFGAN